MRLILGLLLTLLAAPVAPVAARELGPLQIMLQSNASKVGHVTATPKIVDVYPGRG
jgi:hypothetical protein